MRYHGVRKILRRPLLPAHVRRSAPVLIALLAIILSVQLGTPNAGLAANSHGNGVPPATATPLPTDTETPTAVPTSTTAPTSTSVPAATATQTATITATPSNTATAQPATPVSEPSFPQHHVVLLVIDAGREADLTRWKLPHIQALMKHGVVYDRAFVGEMQTSTPNVHVTLGTGTLPRENGFLGFGWAAPDTRKQIDFRTLLANGAIEPVLRKLPQPSVAARLHQFIPSAVSVAASGHKDYAVVGLGGGSADYEIYGKFTKTNFVPTFLPGHTPPYLSATERKRLTLPSKLPLGAEDKWAFQYASYVARHVKPRLLMMNLPEMDTWGHWRGPLDLATVHKLVLNIDRGIGQLEATYRALGILSNTDFIITADHSMMESSAAKNWSTTFAAAKAVNAQVARADGEGGAVWLQNPTQAKQVADELVRRRPAHVEAIFYRSAPGNSYSYVQASPTGWLLNKNASTALKHLVDTTAGQDGPDVWVLYHENYTVVERNVSGLWKGTHGGSTWKVQHIPLIISGPGVRTGVHSQFAARSIDIAPTMERLLGLPGMRRDGIVLADALTQPTGVESRAQKEIAPVVGADAQALQQQSAFDDSGVTRWPHIAVPPYRCTPKTSGCKSTSKTATNS